jgi:DNA helicase-2/ATP-dependent DNA helicase PcrA
MRMPNARDMSDEQQDIFEDAPLDGRILVTGPPGTGKTVIAFLRAILLAKDNKKVDVIMYNRVLKRFAQNVGADSRNVSCRTFHSWFYNWWRNLKIENQNEESEAPIYLTTPFERRLEVKEKGAKWDKNARSWTATQEVVNSAPEVFAPWLPDSSDGNQLNRVNKATYEAPEIRKYKPDWDTLIDLYTEAEPAKQTGWGHLIIDEGQDFCNDTYKFLKYASRISKSDSAITVLADDNQRLGEENSTTTQIADLLNIGEDRKFKLSRNFRNTRPIALLARHFYTGLPSGIPNLPEKKGNKPKLVCDASPLLQVEYIARYLKFRGNHEVGVVLPDNKLRDQFFNSLSENLPSYIVQTYDSKSPRTSENLIFDRQGVVTVLNRQSCKGLEFDVVFLPCLQDYDTEDADSDTFKMNMYVMCSRARNELIMMSETPAESEAGAMKYLPVNEPDLLELISSQE